MLLLKKTHSAVTALAITLLPRASCLEGGIEESAEIAVSVGLS
jgi:hypothetical protein